MKVTELSSRESFADRVQVLVLNTAAGDRQLTELAAEAIYWSMKDKSHVEGNILIYKWKVLNPRMAVRIRLWLLTYGPFTAASDRKVTINGEEVVCEDGVKYSEKACEHNCKGLSPDEVFGRLSTSTTIATWARKKQPKKELTQDDLDKAVERLRKKADEAGLSFRKAIGKDDTDLFESVKSLVHNAQGRTDLDQSQKDFLAKLVVLAAESGVEL